MKYKIIFAVLVIGLFIVGCGEKQETVTGGAFIGGSDGVVVEFEPFSLKEDGVYTIFDSEDFPIGVVVNNRGEEVIPPGKANLRLLGPAKDDFQNIPSWELVNQDEIEKISEFSPEGGEEIIQFTPSELALYTEDVVGFTDVTWNLEYAYDYKTHLIINDVCFKGDVTDDRVCKLQESKDFSVSGAPIQVVSVNEDTGGKGVVLLRIGVKNAGTGKSTIIGQEFDNRFDQIAYTVDEPEKWDCKAGGRLNEARLIGEEVGTAQIICRLKTALTEDEIYTKQVGLTISYVYKDLIQEKLRIKESAR